MEPNDPIFQEKMRALAQMIGQVFAENPMIKEALREMEEEGYRVDITLASVAWVSKTEPLAPETSAFSDSDKTFLQNLRVKWQDETTDTTDLGINPLPP